MADGKPDDIIEAPRCAYQKKHKLPPPDKPGYYLVSLVTSSNEEEYYNPVSDTYQRADYHWYRQDADGGWSHKPGSDSVRRVDSNGMIITNPETAARRDVWGKIKIKGSDEMVDEVMEYDVFCGYFYVKKGGVAVGP